MLRRSISQGFEVWSMDVNDIDLLYTLLILSYFQSDYYSILYYTPTVPHSCALLCHNKYTYHQAQQTRQNSGGGGVQRASQLRFDKGGLQQFFNFCAI